MVKQIYVDVHVKKYNKVSKYILFFNRRVEL